VKPYTGIILVTASEYMRIGCSHLGLAMEYYRQQSAEKTGRLCGRAIYVLVNLCLTSVILQMVFLHQESFEGYMER
jgi:hypothetical protein